MWRQSSDLQQMYYISGKSLKSGAAPLFKCLVMFDVVLETTKCPLILGHVTALQFFLVTLLIMQNSAIFLVVHFVPCFCRNRYHYSHAPDVILIVNPVPHKCCDQEHSVRDIGIHVNCTLFGRQVWNTINYLICEPKSDYGSIMANWIMLITNIAVYILYRGTLEKTLIQSKANGVYVFVCVRIVCSFLTRYYPGGFLYWLSQLVWRDVTMEGTSYDCCKYL